MGNDSSATKQPVSDGESAAGEQVRLLREALSVMLYQATHHSPEREDGSHDARISGAAIRTARYALAKTVSQAPIIGSNFTNSEAMPTCQPPGLRK